MVAVGARSTTEALYLGSGRGIWSWSPAKQTAHAAGCKVRSGKSTGHGMHLGWGYRLLAARSGVASRRALAPTRPRQGATFPVSEDVACAGSQVPLGARARPSRPQERKKIPPAKGGMGIEGQNYSTSYSRVISHRSTDDAITSLTSEIGRDPVLSGVYGRSCSGCHPTCTHSAPAQLVRCILHPSRTSGGCRGSGPPRPLAPYPLGRVEWAPRARGGCPPLQRGTGREGQPQGPADAWCVARIPPSGRTGGSGGKVGLFAGGL